MMLFILFALVTGLNQAGVGAQSCRGPGFTINGCNLSLPIRQDNRCGIAADGAPCPFGACCAESGQCGRSEKFCGESGIPPWGPPREDGRCGVSYTYAGCEIGSICLGTYCVPQDLLKSELTGANWIPTDGTSPPTSAMETTPTACDPSLECPALGPGKPKPGNPSGVGKDHDDLIEISETIDEERYMKNSASVASILAVFAPSIFILFFQLFIDM